ncbi:hypothetical protein V6N11_034432 [Hibiscus sabdariffa]|uniref:Uncharacterized protein n=2 Tax=Hibiscus sabdariffa TaxID=183260 RepID=A0ABR2NMK2_9ROSI
MKVEGGTVLRRLEGVSVCAPVADVMGYRWKIGVVMRVMVGDCDDDDGVKVGGSFCRYWLVTLGSVGACRQLLVQQAGTVGAGVVGWRCKHGRVAATRVQLSRAIVGVGLLGLQK